MQFRGQYTYLLTANFRPGIGILSPESKLFSEQVHKGIDAGLDKKALTALVGLLGGSSGDTILNSSGS